MTKSWEVPSYDCPYCGAQDSTYCKMSSPGDDKHGFPKKKEDEARKLGCRVIYYYDLHIADKNSND